MTAVPTPKKTNRGVEYRPTAKERRQVELMIAGGMTQDDISLALGICRKTLAKHFHVEIDTGRAKYKGKLVAKGMEAALKGDRTWGIFILKTQFGWKERSVTEHTGEDGGPLAITTIRRVIVDPSDPIDPEGAKEPEDSEES